ncbi:hypothetical protein HYC85_010746 [Camellia sinensis]|uniref:CG-1 domain-containing protein n=1 Tax=Camellia sinensis TaxID=4442 RepID=A0A7J7HIR9_CAMSI|nr:hypothetical protein HYC85_010746 [Camellia sinensis]
MTQSGYNINDLVREAHTRWLKPAEVLFILQNYKEEQLTHEPPKKPASGSVFLFNKRVLRFFRKDGHSWRKKKDGRAVGEAHERLKVGNVEALNCYYAHGEQNPNFQRRSFWILDPAYEHIVLVHYREISEGRHSSGSISQLSPESPSTFSQSPNCYTAQHPGSTIVSELYEPHQSPGSVEVSSDAVVKSNGMDHLDWIERKGEMSSSSELEVSQALRRLEEQLSLNDDSLEEIGPFCSENENSNDSECVINDQYKSSASLDDVNTLALGRESGFNQIYLTYLFILDSLLISYLAESDLVGRVAMRNIIIKHWHKNLWLNVKALYLGKRCWSSMEVHQVLSPKRKLYILQMEISLPFEKYLQIGVMPVRLQRLSLLDLFSVIHQKVHGLACSVTSKFRFRLSKKVSYVVWLLPAFQEKSLFVLLLPIGSPAVKSESLSTMLSQVVVLACSSSMKETTKSPDELLLLVRFVRMLLSDPSVQKGDNTESGIYLWDKFKADEDSWDRVIEALLFGNWTSSSTTDWLLQELLKDKLQQWLSSRSRGGCNQPGCSLSKKEQGIIHMVAGLGFEWALNAILNSGVSVNFRDINGWTALHWAAQFGREKMVASLIASGASAGAVTDPTSQDPTGKTPAFIASTNGHKGLAGYLSEVELTSHLSSLKLVENELSKGSAEVEAESAVNSISQRSVATNEDHLSLKDTLAALRNTAQAAARIQAAFRAHSFKKRQQRDASSAAAVASVDEYSILSNDIQGISVASKLAFRNARDYNTAALSIQKKFRGWKGRKDFLAFRQKVVRIQAHVRGHQVRKQYKVFCWAVGVLEKVVLRWRRKRAGLRGFRHETESIDESEDEDILKVFRKQKVEGAIDEAISRVRSMVDSPDARQQYCRMLERYRQAKAELDGTESEVTSTSQSDVCYMDNEDTYQYP